MNYKFATERPDYSHLASGRVFYNLPGAPALPIRLASEIFQRCWAHRAERGVTKRCVLYDPCCGAGYSLSMLSFLHRAAIRAAIGSDVDEQAVRRAEQNLQLLTPEGLERRAAEIGALLAAYGKQAHREALESAWHVQKRVAAEASVYPLSTAAFVADVTVRGGLRQKLGGTRAEVVVADVPYGQHAHWQGAEGAAGVGLMLETLLEVMAPKGIVAVISGKGERAAHAGWRRVEQFQVGKRRVAILEVVGA